MQDKEPEVDGKAKSLLVWTREPSGCHDLLLGKGLSLPLQVHAPEAAAEAPYLGQRNSRCKKFKPVIHGPEAGTHLHGAYYTYKIKGTP